MGILQSILALKIIFISAIVNFILLLLLSLSCRCVPMISHLGSKLMSYRHFQNFYKLHCYLWAVLWISVIVHMIFAITLIGFPF
jgi:hypothetical protein